MEINIRRNGPAPAGSWMVFVPGGACILFGLLILVLPEILVALVAGAFIALGAFLLSLAWRVRSSGRGSIFTMFDSRDR